MIVVLHLQAIQPNQTTHDHLAEVCQFPLRV